MGCAEKTVSRFENGVLREDSEIFRETFRFSQGSKKNDFPYRKIVFFSYVLYTIHFSLRGLPQICSSIESIFFQDMYFYFLFFFL